MQNLVTAPIRASRHLAIWLVWQSTGVTLLAPRRSQRAPCPASMRQPGRQGRHGGG